MKLIIKLILIWFKYRKILDPRNVDLNNKIDKDCVIQRNVRISNSIIESKVFINDNARIFNTDISKYASIGPNVIIGENEHIISGEFISDFLYSQDQIEQSKKINERRTTIGFDAWICAGAIIKKGIKVGEGAVVGAGAVVVKDVQPYDVVVGVPAKVIKKRTFYISKE